MARNHARFLQEPLLMLCLAAASGALVVALPFWSLVFWILGIALLSQYPEQKRNSWLYIGVFLFTASVHQVAVLKQKNHPFQHIEDGTEGEIVGFVTTPPREHARTFSQTMQVMAKTEKTAKPISGKLIAFTQEPLEVGRAYYLKGVFALPLSFENPGVFSYKKYLERQGVYRIFFARKVERRGKVLSPMTLFASLGWQIGKRFLQELGEKKGRFLVSLVLGHRFLGMPDDLKEVFKRVGIMHIVAASGFHLGMLLLFLGSAGLLRFGWRSFLLAFGVLFSYALMTGFPLSIQRALIMGLFFVYAFVFRRPYSAVQGFFLAFILLVIVSPDALYQVDFQLSFLSTLAILLCLPLARFQKGLTGGLLTIFVLSASALLFTAPVVAFHFHQLALLTPFFQVLFVPLAFALFFLSLLSFFPLFFSLLKPLLSLGAGCFLFFAETFARLPFSAFISAKPGFLFYALYYSGLMAFFLFGRKKSAASLIGLAFLFNMLFSALPKKTELFMLDVGQGESLVFITGHFVMLVDGGGPTGGRALNDFIGDQVLIPFLLSRGLKRIDLAVLTHPDSDHIAGLFPVFRNLAVHTFLYGGDESDPFLRKLIALAKAKGISVSRAEAGTSIVVPKKTVITVLHPPGGHMAVSSNNQSVVLQISHPSGKILLTGDIEQEAEQMLVKNLTDIDVLKVAHHGSRSSSTMAFLEKVKPEIALISAGKNNPYGHPHSEVLKRLAEASAATYSTSRFGCLVVNLAASLSVRPCLSR